MSCCKPLDTRKNSHLTTGGTTLLGLPVAGELKRGATKCSLVGGITSVVYLPITSLQNAKTVALYEKTLKLFLQSPNNVQ